MATHRSQAQFERAKWRAAVLFPVWLLQLLLSMSMMGLFAWSLGNTLKNYDEREKGGKVPAIEFA
jgi:thiol:disulfide interchange protein